MQSLIREHSYVIHYIKLIEYKITMIIEEFIDVADSTPASIVGCISNKM